METNPPEGFKPLFRTSPFLDHNGPFFYRENDDGTFVVGLRIQPKHANARGIAHGGMLMTFADAAFGQAAWDATDHADVVTLNMQSQFLAPTKEGDWLEVLPVLTRRTRSLLFLRGDFTVDGLAVFSVSSVWKILGAN